MILNFLKAFFGYPTGPSKVVVKLFYGFSWQTWFHWAKQKQKNGSLMANKAVFSPKETYY